MGVFPTQEKKAEEKEEEEAEVKEEEYHLMRNEMIFCLKEAPEYQISAVGEWRENARGDIVQEEADTYFLHVTTGQRCESVRDCFDGWSEPDEESTEFPYYIVRFKLCYEPRVYMDERCFHTT